MKQETKELIKWIEFTLKDYENNVKGNSHLGDKDRQCELNYIKRSIEFLNSLPEIESHLCRGGYIQDRNGTPCCDGDRVSYCINSKGSCGGVGILFWDKELKCFCLIDKYPVEKDDEGTSYNMYYLNKLEYFEKISYPRYLDKSWDNVEAELKKSK